MTDEWTTILAGIGQKIHAAHALVDRAIREKVIDEGKELAGIVALFSGGNDSTTLAHMFRDRVTHFAHANTGIGIEETRQYVRDTASGWGVSLLERHAEDGATFRDLVLGQCRARTGPNAGTVLWPGGFPGPGAHAMMYQRLKERALEKVRNEIVINPYRRRVVFLAGRRSAESQRRSGLALKGPIERRGSVVWVSPLLDWTKLDLTAYRYHCGDVPRNEVSDTLHMSGECLCGAFAHPGEIEEIETWYPGAADQIHALEREVRASGVAEAKKCRWGWGDNKNRTCREACND